MDISSVCELNMELQFLCMKSIQEFHRQNFYAGIKSVEKIINGFSRYIEFVMLETTLLSESQQNIIVDGLENIMMAQENRDYVLLADLLELQLLLDLRTLQEQMIAQYKEADNDYFENNCCAIKSRNKNLLVELMRAKQNVSDNCLWTETTCCGAKTLAGQDEKGKFYFHSNVNPQYEAYEQASWYYNPQKKRYVVFGIGLGYHIDALIGFDEGIEITVVEPDIDVLLLAFENHDISIWLKNADINIVYDPQLIRFSEIVEEDVELYIHYPSLRNLRNNALKEKMEHIFIRDSGIRNQNNLMVSNFRENILNCKKNIDELKTEFDGKKAIIVAAGPSLDKNVEELRNVSKDNLVISTGTAFHKLLECGISVDYVIVTDAQPSIRDQFRDNMDKKIPALILSTASKCVAREYQGDAYIIYQKDYDLAEKKALETGTSCYETGGSVVTTALDVCIRLGCSKIAFIGLDLAYSGEKRHAEGTAKVNNIDTSGMEMVPGYDIVNDEIKEIEVPTSHLFTMYRNWISRRIVRNDVNIPIYDASEGGSIVRGTSIITLKQYIHDDQGGEQQC